MKVSVFIAASLDGYIARSDGGLDWLEDPPDLEEDYGYKAFIRSVDTLAMGRGAFEKVLTFPEWPYEGKRVIVLSRTLRQLPPGFKERAELRRELPAQLVEHLRCQGCTRIYVDGCLTIEAFLNAGLITALTLTRIPPSAGWAATCACCTRTPRAYFSGFVQSTYTLPA
ncbi:MAG: dihydrofolate reductase family protein [Candidatus Handelsmanbacteria bacterium]|nr:dihydrofolate reductase family protein [Candidatus Handelsmanbacteria bacterium]